MKEDRGPRLVAEAAPIMIRITGLSQSSTTAAYWPEPVQLAVRPAARS